MTMIVRRIPAHRRNARSAFRAGTAVAALILSSCSSVGLNGEPDTDVQSAQRWDRSAGPPLQLGASLTTDWVDQIGTVVATDAPMSLALSGPNDWTDVVALPEQTAASGADRVRPIWSGLALNTVSLAGIGPVDPPAEVPLPLLVADGRYHWPSLIDPELPAETPCIRDTGVAVAQVDCLESSDQIALAPTTVDDAMLADQRGGFITVGGLQIDIGIRVETLVNGVTQLTTALTLDDVINGGLEGIQIGQVTLGTGDAATDIIHNVGLGNVNTVISNSQDDVNISTLATLAIDVINLQQPQIGNSFGASGRMSPELQQSIIRGIGP